MVFTTGIRKVITDITHVSCSQQCIADGMNEHVGIAMAQESEGMRNEDATQPKVAPRHQLVHIVSHAYTYVHPTYV